MPPAAHWINYEQPICAAWYREDQCFTFVGRQVRLRFHFARREICLARRRLRDIIPLGTELCALRVCKHLPVPVNMIKRHILLEKI